MASYTIDWRESPPAACRHGVVSIGNFDGVHRGHAALIAGLRSQARARGCPAIVLTFDPHPLSLLRPPALLPLTTVTDRTALLEKAGADLIVIMRTTRELLSLTAAEFFSRVIQQQLGARGLIEGFNFAFGRNREGTVKTLEELGHAAGIRVTIVPPQRFEDRDCSSSAVRNALLHGDIAEANALLGRPYRLHGLISVGQRRGRTIGFPTANLDPVWTLPPRDGVYAVRVPVGDQTFSGAANVGPNPTFGEDARKVEVHLIDFQGDLYGQRLAVDFHARLRDTQTFAGPEALIAQLKQDVEQAHEILK